MSRINEDELLALASYWDQRYADSQIPHGDGQLHEWFRDFESLRPWFAKHLLSSKTAGPQITILHLGCGDSTVPRELYALGYATQICVDFSDVVIKRMQQRFMQHEYPGILWKCADVRDLPEADASVDVAFDKGTFDAMIHGSPWSPPDIVQDNTRRYMKEVARVLKDDGIFLYITFRQPHFLEPLLNRDQLWQLQFETLADCQGSFEYYGFILRKATTSKH